MQRLRLKLEAEWFVFLSEDQQLLVKTAISLFEFVETSGQEFFDYSFIVFPMAKAYEGFLKRYLNRVGLISQEVYESNRFRIGRALNPDLNHNHRDEHWYYDDIESVCGKEIGREMWETWLTCRNQVFHYFPNKNHFLSQEQARQYLIKMMDSMDHLINCKEMHDRSS